MKIQYQKEIKVWMGFEVPLDVVLEHNKELNTTNVEELLSVEKAEGNGLNVWEYFDEDHLECVSFYDCEETGNTWQNEVQKDEDHKDVEITTFGELLSLPEVMGDKELLNKLISVIKTHKEV